ARGAVVDAREEELRRREAYDDRAVGLAADILPFQQRQVDAGDDVAGRIEGQLVAGQRIWNEVVCLLDRADAGDAHGCGLEAVEVADTRHERSQVDRFLLRSPGADGGLIDAANKKPDGRRR